MKHIKQDFSLNAWVQSPVEGPRPKSNFLNMVMLHIKFFPVSFSNKHFVSSSPANQHFLENRRRKLSEILEHLLHAFDFFQKLVPMLQAIKR